MGKTTDDKSGNKTGDDAGGDAGDGPKFVTADDLARVVNAAITTHTKRLETKIAEQIATALKVPEKTEEKTGGDGKPDPMAAQLAKITADLAQERKAREDEKREREAERSKALRMEQSAALATALRDAGIVDKTMAKAAQALLESDGVVTRDDAGAIKFRTVDKYGTETLVELSEGLAGWSKGDGMAFMPARKVAGSGTTAPKSGSTSSGKPDPKAEALAEARSVFNEFLAGSN